jgi:hypothetical protein
MNLPVKATPVLAAMAGAVIVVAITWLIGLTSQQRLERMSAVEVQEVFGAYDRLIASAESLDLDSLFRDVVENDRGALAVNGQLFLTRTSALERTQANFHGIARLHYRVDERHVTMLTADVALLVATGASDVGLVDGRNLSSTFVHTVVFVRRDGAWRVIHSHQSAPVPR